MNTLFSHSVYLSCRYAWVLRQIHRAMAHASAEIPLVEMKTLERWLKEARQMRERKGFNETKAKRVVSLLHNISSLLEKHVPAMAELTRELREAETK